MTTVYRSKSDYPLPFAPPSPTFTLFSLPSSSTILALLLPPLFNPSLPPLHSHASPCPPLPYPPFLTFSSPPFVTLLLPSSSPSFSYPLPSLTFLPFRPLLVLPSLHSVFHTLLSFPSLHLFLPLPPSHSLPSSPSLPSLPLPPLSLSLPSTTGTNLPCP